MKSRRRCCSLPSIAACRQRTLPSSWRRKCLKRWTATRRRAHPSLPTRHEKTRGTMLNHILGVLFDGIAYGSLLFLISVGLSVTMGLMNFVNLAHGAFAMAGGYVCVIAMTRFGVPFLATLPLAFVVMATVGAVLERLLYRRLYGASHLDQVLFSIGLTFMSIAAATYFFGSSQQPMRLPQFLRGQVHLGGVDFGIYRLLLVAVVAALTTLLGVLLSL